MTNARLRAWTISIVAFWIVLAVLLVMVDEDIRARLQPAVPLLALAPASWLGFQFQRRLAYLKVLDDLRAPTVEIARDLLGMLEKLRPDTNPMQPALPSVVDALRTVLLHAEALGVEPRGTIEEAIQVLTRVRARPLDLRPAQSGGTILHWSPESLAEIQKQLASSAAEVAAWTRTIYLR